MALPHQSIATINSPEFINLQPLDINPLMSKCQIKVLYIGENRNRSYISKEVAAEMAKTLRGAPIVGYYKESKEDFADHGEQMVWDDEGIHFNCLTKPYGFVAPDAKVWFQKFNDSDDFGNQIQREYLMTTGYLWTGQFEEVQSAIDEGKPQSMELDENTLNGHWATNVKNDVEFFIINDAIFTKLCILGDDTEPCFEGASVTKPIVSSNFSRNIDDNFKKTLFSMINDLKDALKGGNEMAQEEKLPVEEFTEEGTQETVETSEPVVDTPIEESTENVDVDNTEVSDTFEAESSQNEENENVDFVKKDEDDNDDKDDVNDQDDTDDTVDPDDEDDDDKKKYSLLEQQYNELSTQYEQLKAENEKLVEFKNQVENEKKDALINEFYMLSEDDKKDIIENKANYSLDEIKAKLAVICFEKKVNFNSENSDEIDTNKEEEKIVTYTYSEDESNLPDWVRAVKNNIDND